MMYVLAAIMGTLLLHTISRASAKKPARVRISRRK